MERKKKKVGGMQKYLKFFVIVNVKHDMFCWVLVCLMMSGSDYQDINQSIPSTSVSTRALAWDHLLNPKGAFKYCVSAFGRVGSEPKC